MVCWKVRQDTPPRSSPATMGTTRSAPSVIAEPGLLVRASTKDRPR